MSIIHALSLLNSNIFDDLKPVLFICLLNNNQVIKTFYLVIKKDIYSEHKFYMRYKRCKLFSSSLNETYVFIHLAVSFEDNKFLILMKLFNYSCPFMNCTFGVIHKKSLTNTR